VLPVKRLLEETRLKHVGEEQHPILHKNTPGHTRQDGEVRFTPAEADEDEINKMRRKRREVIEVIDHQNTRGKIIQFSLLVILVSVLGIVLALGACSIW
jgi:hypothetical protein